jgi:hypothetical protein
MIVKVRIPRFASAGSPQATAAPAAQPASPRSTFHAALTDSAEEWVVRENPRIAFTPRPEPAPRPEPTALVEPSKAKRLGPSPLLRALSWLQTKVVQTATKRLRVAETVSLGEKRFVSIVNVEGREFLIGGGASGVTLLAQLSPAQPSAAQELTSVGMKSVRGDVA